MSVSFPCPCLLHAPIALSLLLPIALPPYRIPPSPFRPFVPMSPPHSPTVPVQHLLPASTLHDRLTALPNPAIYSARRTTARVVLFLAMLLLSFRHLILQSCSVASIQAVPFCTRVGSRSLLYMPLLLLGLVPPDVHITFDQFHQQRTQLLRSRHARAPYQPRSHTFAAVVLHKLRPAALVLPLVLSQSLAHLPIGCTPLSPDNLVFRSVL